ncbi:MAG TPA: ABC transporter substrate-binding protein, partial [Anaerolineae bacterium]|nr:ABC transporter substrate-binding protein [Anaerolineae bacterium]
SANGVERVDDHTVTLHLTRPEIAVPEHLFHYPAMILPRDFEGDWLKQPYGTGPFVLKEWIPEERAVAERRPDYWRNGADGQALPYLDRLEWYHLGDERAAHIAAMQSGQADVMEMPQVEDFLALRNVPGLVITPVVTGQTNVLRMRADVEPWSDPRVRKALMLCQDRKKILETAAFGEGAEGQDHHVAPVHPEYCSVDTPAYDPERAKQLLAEAGYPDGLDVQLTVGTAWADQVSYAETLKVDAEPAGFRLTINTMPGTEYWNVWTEVDLGITIWTHRPLGTMVMSLAYTVDEKGQPTAWNETKWVDEEFITLLNEANSTVDLEARRQVMCKLEQIQQERGTVGVPYWRNCWRICTESVKGLEPHPSNYDDFSAVWLDKKS